MMSSSSSAIRTLPRRRRVARMVLRLCAVCAAQHLTGCDIAAIRNRPCGRNDTRRRCGVTCGMFLFCSSLAAMMPPTCDRHPDKIAAAGRGAAGNPDEPVRALCRARRSMTAGSIDEDLPPLRTEVAIERPRKVITRNTSPDICVRPVDQSLSRLRAWLHLLFCAAQPRLSRPVAGARFRDPAGRAARGAGGAGARTAAQALSARARSPSAPTPIPTSRSNASIGIMRGVLEVLAGASTIRWRSSPRAR